MLLKDFFTFIWRPTPAGPAAASSGLWPAAWAMARVWALVYVLTFLAAMAITVALAVAGQSAADNAVTQLATEGGVWLTVWLGVLAIPFWEELAFRLGLRPSRVGLSVAAAALVMFLAQLPLGFFSEALPDWLFSPLEAAGVVSLVVAIGGLAAAIWWGLGRLGPQVQTVYERLYPGVFYGSAVLFALLHSLNYTRLSEIWFLAPLLVLPQLILAVGLGYVRVRLGFVWAVLMHVLHNAFSLLPVVMLAQLSPALTQRALAGDWAAFAELPPSTALLFAAASLVWFGLLLALFLSGVGLVWDWVQARGGRRHYAWIATLLNCLLPGLGQIYNEQPGKGRVLIGLYLVFTLVLGGLLSVPAVYAAPQWLVGIGLGALIGYLLLYGYATTDGWLVGRRLDKRAG